METIQNLTDHFSIFYHIEDEEFGSYIANHVDGFYLDLCNHFKFSTTDRFGFKIYVANSGDEYIKLSGKNKETYQLWMVGYSDFNKRIICILSPSAAKGYSRNELMQVVKHEIVHGVFDLKLNVQEVEAWISEGVALLYAGQIDLQDVDEIIPIDIISGITINGDTPDNFVDNGGYDVAGIYVSYFIHKYGHDAFIRAYKNELKLEDLISKNFEEEAIEYYQNLIK